MSEETPPVVVPAPPVEKGLMQSMSLRHGLYMCVGGIIAMTACSWWKAPASPEIFMVGLTALIGFASSIYGGKLGAYQPGSGQQTAGGSIINTGADAS